MRVSDVFAMGGGSGYGDRYGYPPSKPSNNSGRFTYVYYSTFAVKNYGDDGSGYNGGFRSESFTRGRNLVGVLG